MSPLITGVSARGLGHMRLVSPLITGVIARGLGQRSLACQFGCTIIRLEATLCVCIVHTSIFSLQASFQTPTSTGRPVLEGSFE